MKNEELIMIIEDLREELDEVKGELKELKKNSPPPASKEISSPKKKKAISIIWNIVFYFSLVAIVLGIAVFGLQEQGAPPRNFFGYSAMTVLSGSMEPTISKGSLVVLRQTDPATLEVGDIVTYIRENNTTVTHRIVEIIDNYQDRNMRGFKLQGDNNVTPDVDTVLEINVMGEIIYSNMFLGQLISFVQERVIIIIVFIVLFVAFIQVIKRFFLVEEEPKILIRMEGTDTEQGYTNEDTNIMMIK